MQRERFFQAFFPASLNFLLSSGCNLKPTERISSKNSKIVLHTNVNALLVRENCVFSSKGTPVQMLYQFSIRRNSWVFSAAQSWNVLCVLLGFGNFSILICPSVVILGSHTVRNNATESNQVFCAQPPLLCQTKLHIPGRERLE